MKVGRIMVATQPLKKVNENPSGSAGHGVLCLTFQHKLEDHSPGLPEHKRRPYLKNNQSEKGWEMVQVVECLSSRHEALGSHLYHQNFTNL
jgi:hypothetical protein